MNDVITNVPPAAEPEAPALSQLERVIFIFTSPGKTFQDLLRNTNWLLPFLISLIVGGVYIFAVQKQVGWETVTENQMKLSPKAEARMEQMPPEQREKAMQMQVGATRIFSYGFPVLLLLTGVVVAGVLLATLNFVLGGHAKFSSLFALFFYATLPGNIKTLLAILTLFLGMSPESFNIRNPAATNIGFFLPPDMPHWLIVLLSSVDIFTIWTVVLFTLGASVVAKVSRSTAAIAVVGWWVILVLLGTVTAAIQG